MYKMYSEQAEQIINLSKIEAANRKEESVSTAHILLAILKEDCDASRALQALGIEAKEIEEEIDSRQSKISKILNRSSSPTELPFTPEAKLALEMALRSALQLNHNYVGSIDLALGLMKVEDSLVAKVLDKLSQEELLQNKETTLI